MHVRAGVVVRNDFADVLVRFVQCMGALEALLERGNRLPTEAECRTLVPARFFAD